MEEAVHKVQQAKMLRLVTHSFCRELLNHGFDRHDMVTVSIELLDYAIGDGDPGARALQPAVGDFTPDGIERLADDVFRYDGVRIEPFTSSLFPAAAEWIGSSDLQRNFAIRFPEDEAALYGHFFEVSHTRYFGIWYEDAFVGLIGGEHIDPAVQKVEMKKFIGEVHYRGRGIGKTATFLWLHYVFQILGFNKVYLYSLDTNIRNINLNSQLGFELEGTLFEDVMVGGEYRDVVRMSLLRSRWEALFGKAAR